MEKAETVFRSMDPSAEEDARSAYNTIRSAGIGAFLLDDSEPGVPEGVWEVRVAAADRLCAEDILAVNPPDDGEPAEVDPSHSLDLVPVFSPNPASTEDFEVQTVKSLLEANGIYAVVIGDARFPNLPEVVQVAQENEAKARELIADALAAGPAAAEEAERAGEER